MKKKDFQFDYSTFRYEDIGLFSAFISMPLSLENLLNYYENEIEQSLFQPYRKRLWNNLKRRGNLNKLEEKAFNKALGEYANSFYIPKAYCMLGRWDLMVLGLCDDFEFGVRTFKSHSPAAREGSTSSGPQSNSPNNFSYQVITGISPSIDKVDASAGKLLTLYDMWNKLGFPSVLNGAVGITENGKKAQKEYLSAIKKNDPNAVIKKSSTKYPLVGVCSLKISNALLIGNSAEFYTRAIGEVFKKAIGNGDSHKKKNIAVVLVETNSWHEIQLLIFGFNYVDIAECIDSVKRITLFDISDYNHKTSVRLLEKSLLGQGNRSPSNPPKLNYAGSHIFSKAIVTFGFDFDIIRKMKNAKNGDLDQFLSHYKIDKTENKISFVQRWFIKPGHIDEVKNKLKAKGIKLQKSNYHTYGNADYSVKKTNVSSYDLVKHILECHDTKGISNCIYQTFSVPEVIVAKEKEPPQKNGHHFFHQKLNHLQFSKKDILKVSKCLKELGISKVTAEKITNLYANFNDNIVDSLMYTYFLELWPMLKILQQTLEEYIDLYRAEQANTGSGGNFHMHDQTRFQDALENFSEDYLNAHGNRYLQGHSMTELGDHNFYFKGGIHQLVSTIDSIYKIIASINGHDASIATITASQRVESTQNAIKLNLFHIYQPEVFFAIATHEALNHSFESFIEENTLNSQPRHRPNKNTINEAFKSMRRLKAELAASIADVKYNVVIPASIDANREMFDCDQLAHYLLIDWMVYRFCYRDFEVFARLHWFYMLQQPETYKKPGVPDTFNIDHMYLRLRLLYEVIKRIDPGLQKPFKLPKEPLIDAAFSHSKISFLNNVIENSIINSSSLKLIRQIGINYIEEIAVTLGAKVQIDKKDTDDLDSAQNVTKDFESVIGGRLIPDFDLFNFATLNKARNSKELESQLYNSFIAFSTRFNHLVRDYITFVLGEEGKISILPRTANGSAGKTTAANNILFDPRGGMFVTMPHVRRQHLRLSTAMLRSFWLISNQLKATWAGKMINNIFNEINYPSKTQSLLRKSFTLFLSHTSKSNVIFKEIAEESIRRITQNNQKPLVFDYNQREGRYRLYSFHGPINYATSTEVKNADKVIIEISDQSLTSPYCISEIKAALDAKRSNEIHYLLIRGVSKNDLVKNLFNKNLFNKSINDTKNRLKLNIEQVDVHSPYNLNDAREFLAANKTTKLCQFDQLIAKIKSRSCFYIDSSVSSGNKIKKIDKKGQLTALEDQSAFYMAVLKTK